MASRKPKHRDDDDEMVGDSLSGLPPLPGAIVVGDSEVATESQEEKDIDDILAEVGSSVSVKISRVNPLTGNAAWVGTMRGEDFTVDQLADTYGGGSYVLRILKGKEIIRKTRLEIDSTIPARNPRAPREQSAGQPSQSGDMLTAIMASQMDSSRKTMELMTTMIAGIGTAMTSMMQVVAATKDVAPKENSLETIRAVAEIMKPQSQTKSTISELKDIMEVARELNGGGSGDSDPTIPLIGKAIDTVGKIVSTAQATPRPPAPPVVVHPNPPVTPPTNAPALALVPNDTTETKMPTLRPWMTAIEPQLPLLRMSVGRIKPEIAADIIVDNLDDNAFGDLILDITDGLSEGTEVDTAKLMPFAQRVVTAFELPAESAPWLSEVAIYCLEAANDELGEETTMEAANANPPE